jgi:pimeloyl-ACP methyl ester carboxylesterase
MNMAQSTITLECSAHASDHELPDVQTTIDSPAEVVGRALLFHGFGRKPDALDELVAVLVENNIEVVRPYLKSKARQGGLNDRDLMRAVAREFAAFNEDTLPVVVIGHSAGGAVAMVAAEQFLQEALTLTGVLLIDSNGKIEELMAPALAALQHESIPVRTIAAAAGRCNRQAQIAHWLAGASAGFVGVQLTTGRHCDVEGSKADVTCRLLCGGAADPKNAAVVYRLTAGWSHAWLTRKSHPEIEPEGERISIWQELNVLKVL